MKNFSTLAELLAFQSKTFNNPKALNFKEDGQWRSFSNQEFFTKAFYFACGLKELGFKKGQKIAISSYQNPIWLIADLGSILAGGVTVPIFHKISKENLLYELKDCDAKYAFTDQEGFIDEVEGECSLKIIGYGIQRKKVTSYADLIFMGKEAADEGKYDVLNFMSECEPQDLATIIYTSGSTGTPKGVELSHENLASQVASTSKLFPLNSDDKALSFLPLAHIFERMVMMFYISQGISVYFADDIKDVSNLLKEVKPNLMTAVPRVLEKVYGRINEKVADMEGFKKTLAKMAVKRALTKDPNGKTGFKDKLYNILVYKKLRDNLGGNLRMIICGGAALSENMERFYSNINIGIFCGYGLTEASPVISVNYPGAKKFGTVGKVFPSVEIKLGEAGELLAKGPNIMQGYHNQEEQTAQVIEDCWLKTGDLATIDDEGFVKIIGRKKELFKNANGKYVCPVPIEQKLVEELPFTLGAIVIAEGRKFTSALLFPDFENLPKSKERLQFLGSDEAFLTSEILHKHVDNKITKINSTLNHWEKVQKFAIVTKEISIDGGQITPSMKLKRSLLENEFVDIIDGFYEVEESEVK